jgi:predicted phage-related endonuclease
MEPAIAAWAAHKYETPLRKFPGYVVHKTVVGMGCTPDYINQDASLVVQIKNVDGLEFYKNPNWEADGEVLTKCPMHIMLQVQHELACTGAGHGWLVVCVGGNRLLKMDIAPRPTTIAKLEAEVKAFWDSVHLSNEPKPDYTADGDTIALLMPEPVVGKAVDLSLNNRAHECAAEYLRGKAMEKSGEAIAETAKAELMEMLGDAEAALIGDYKLSNKQTKASPGKIITAAMIGEIIGAKKGSRRFTVTQTGAAQ